MFNDILNFKFWRYYHTQILIINQYSNSINFYLATDKSLIYFYLESI